VGRNADTEDQRVLRGSEAVGRNADTEDQRVLRGSREKQVGAAQRRQKKRWPAKKQDRRSAAAPGAW
jgi:hypothetical protein